MSFRRGAFGEHEKLGPFIDWAFTFENAGVRAPIDRFVVDDRELSDLQRFRQKDGSPLCEVAGLDGSGAIPLRVSPL